MDILNQEQGVLKAKQQFDALLQSIEEHTQQQTRIDRVERSLFADLQALGLTLLQTFATAAGAGDQGEQTTLGERTLSRSEKPQRRWYRSVFGKLAIWRWVYRRGPKQKIEHAPTDARLGLPHGECSYVLEDWQQRLGVQVPFAPATEGLAAVLGTSVSVQTAEEMNVRMAAHAESFRLQQAAPATPEAATILVATADGTSVPMRREDSTTQPSLQAGARSGTTRRAYVGGVYAIEPFVRQPQEVLDELFRQQAAARRPTPCGKRLWAEMAAAEEDSGSEFVFIEMAIDLKTRDPAKEQTLVCLMDGERKLWDLQSQWLGRAVEILDFFHVLERVREVAKVVHPGDKSSREAWVSDQASDLLSGKVETVIRRWRRLSGASVGWSASQQETVRSAIRYFCNNRRRMDYGEYLASGYPIGSGTAEGACRNLVKDRLDRTGMHWRFPGARAMLKTRALYLNGEWDEFVEYRIQKEQESLYQTAA